MNCILQYTFKLYNKIFPPLKFNLNKKKDLDPTDEDLDKWATEWLEKRDMERRCKRDKHKR